MRTIGMRIIGMEDNWHAEYWHGGQLALIFFLNYGVCYLITLFIYFHKRVLNKAKRATNRLPLLLVTEVLLIIAVKI